jgi:hypothetical protein
MTTYLQQEGAYIKTEKEESSHSIRPLPSTVTVSNGIISATCQLLYLRPASSNERE